MQPPPQRLERSLSSSRVPEAAVFPLSPAHLVWLERAHADISLAWPSSPLASCARLSQPVAVFDDFLSAAVSDPPPLPLSLTSSQPASARSTSSASSMASSSSPHSSSRSASPPPRTVTSSPTVTPSTLSCPSSPAPEPRVTDAERRRREKAALDMLEKLSPEEDASDWTRGGVAATASTTPRRRKRNRLTVLEASAKRIHQLERLLNTAELAKHMAEAQVRALSEASMLVKRERESVQLVDASRTLHATGRLRDRVARTLFDCRSGRLLDASSSFFDVTGFTPSGALQRVLNPRFVHRTQPGDKSTACEVALVQTRSRGGGTGGQCSDDAATEWVPIQPCRQYPRTLQLMQEFHTGQRDSFRAVFRNRFADGYMYELPQKLCWVVDAEWVHEADGSKWRRPLTRATAYSLDDCMRVEEEWE